MRVVSPRIEGAACPRAHGTLHPKKRATRARRRRGDWQGPDPAEEWDKESTRAIQTHKLQLWPHAGGADRSASSDIL